MIQSCLPTNLLRSFSSKHRCMTEKHVLIGRKHDMLGNQTFEVLRPLSKISHQSLNVFEFVDMFFVKQIQPKLQTRYCSVQGFQK